MNIVEVVHSHRDYGCNEYRISSHSQMRFVGYYDTKNVTGPVHIRFRLESSATLECDIFIDRCDIEITIEILLCGDGAQAQIRGAYILDQENTVSIQSIQHHYIAHTKSELIMKGLLTGKSKVDYRGKIIIDQKAIGAYASQENKNMILSNHARAVSIPSLEVLTNDVHCFHGSAMGRVDENQLFYLRARGIDKDRAYHLLLQAFFSHLFKDIQLDQKLSSTIEKII